MDIFKLNLKNSVLLFCHYKNLFTIKSLKRTEIKLENSWC